MMKKVALLCVLLVATTLGSYTWHALTVAYAQFLSHAIPTSPEPYSAWTRPLTDVFGCSFMVPGNLTLEPHDYERFVALAGRGSWWGLGTLKSPRTLEYSSATAWVLRVGLMMAALQFLAASIVAGGVLLIGGAKRLQVVDVLGRTTPAGWCFAILMPVVSALGWYAWLPRSHLDSALFRAHDSGVFVLLALAGTAGIVQGVLDAWSARVYMRHDRCPRCGYPRTGLQPKPDLCTDCGWEATPDRVSRMHLRRFAVAVAVLALLTGAAAFVWVQAGPRGTTIWHRDWLVWWLAMRPMGRS